MRRVGDSNWLYLGVEKGNSKHVSDANNRVADGVGYCFRLLFGRCCTHIKIGSDNGDQLAKRDGR